jgi:pimeloyl-ACP methyl ester carboxylesterase
MKNIFLLLALAFVVSCKPNVDPIDNSYIKLLEEGTGFIKFAKYEPFADKPVDIFYHIPEGIDMTTAPIVLVFHGMSRNADDYRDYWISSAEKYNLMIFAPEFTDELYPSVSDANSLYNFGNMITYGQLNPREEWTFSMVNPIFDFIRLITASENEKFYMFGHSAGAQFVQRCITFMPEVKTEVAVAANAGWYTVPDYDVDYPYGLKNSFLPADSLPKVFDRNVVILLGTADTLRTSNLRQSEEADLQGLTRYERGHYYFEESMEYAGENGLTFRWTTTDVPDIGHSGSGMSVAAANLLFGDTISK